MKYLKNPFDFDVKKLSNLRTVGKIETICFPENVHEVQKAFKYAKENGLNPFILGGGSNTLIGHLNTTMLICDRMYQPHLEIIDDKITVSANTKINDLISIAAKKRLYGVEFLGGLPANLGGLISMNAGAYQKNISDFIEWLIYVDDDGEKIMYKKDIEFGYRNTNINGFVSKVCLKLFIEKDNDFLSLIKSRIDYFIKDRESKHPMNYPCLGCFFKNTEQYTAGYLIEKAGLKSYKIGDAMVSPKHANFLVNTGNALFEDFIELIDYIKKTVYQMYNINLELEIKIINDKKNSAI